MKLYDIKYDKITKRLVKSWFNFFNEVIFGGVLKYFDYVTLDDLDRNLYWGMIYYYSEDIDGNEIEEYELKIHSDLEPKKFLETLGHEMIHLYQGQILKDFSLEEPIEGNIFYQFQELFSVFGLNVCKIV